MGHYGPEEWWYPDGTLAASVQAIVFEGDQSTFASIFSDSGLTVPLANPTTTDGSGLLEFYAADGDYWVYVGDNYSGDSELVTLGPAATGAVLSVNGQTGVVVLGASDVGAQPIATINAKGDLYVGTANDTTTRQAVGSDGQVLTADSAQSTGVKWATPAAGGVTSVNGQVGVVVLTASDVGAQPIVTIDAKGDLYAGTGDNATARLAVGTDGQYLRAASGQSTGLEYHTVTASDVGAVPTSRTLTAGTAMTGGGDLSADRTFNVNIGTTAGTAAAGDDSRITGAQQRSTLTTKGDLYAATASATTTRLPVGSDGQVVRANSAQATGLEYHTLTASDVSAVPTSRTITAGTGLTGGGDLSADRTINANVGTTAGTLAAGDDSRITGAQQKSTLTAKGDIYVATASGVTTRLPVGSDTQVLSANSAQSTGLEWVAAGGGGIPATILDAKGDLIAASAADTAARLAVGSDGQYLRAASGQATGLEYHTIVASDVGAIASTLVDAKGDIVTATANDTPARLAVGSDNQVLRAASGQSTGLQWATLAASDVGAQPIATVTTKGDLYVATASATVTRLGVGANGQVLSADSAQSTGAKWGYTKAAAMYPRSTGYVPTGGVITTRSSKTATVNTMYLIPFALLADATLSSIAFEVTANIATAVVRLGIYASDATTLLPTGAATADYGTTAADTTGSKSAAVSTALTAGVWWLAFVGQTAGPTVRQCAGWTPYVASATFPTGSGVGWDNCYVQTGVSGALPTIGSIADSDGPMCGIKF